MNADWWKYRPFGWSIDPKIDLFAVKLQIPALYGFTHDSFESDP